MDYRIALRVDGGGPYTMVLDTGASATLADDDARALHLQTGHGFEMGGTCAGHVRACEAQVRTQDLGRVSC